MRGHAGTFSKNVSAPIGGGIVQTNLIRHYDMQDPTSYNGIGSVITDLSPAGVNGNIGGSPLWTIQGGANCLRFGGQWVDAGSHSATNWTISMWVRYYASNASGDKRLWSAHNQVDFLFRSNNLCMYSPTGGLFYPGMSLSPTTEWHKIDVTYNNSPKSLKFYKNNVLIHTRTANARAIPYLNFMRYRGGGYYAYGYVGEMLWYDRALDAGEITTNWDATRASYGK